jgi:hypothetical protein
VTAEPQSIGLFGFLELVEAGGVRGWEDEPSMPVDQPGSAQAGGGVGRSMLRVLV